MLFTQLVNIISSYQKSNDDNKKPKVQSCRDDNKDKTLLDELLKQYYLGRRAGNSFKPQAWKEITMMFNHAFSPEMNVEQIKTRVRRVSIGLSKSCI